MALNLSDPKERNKLLLALLPLMVLFIYWYMYHGDRVAANTELRTHFEELDTKNTAAKVTAAKGGPELKKRLAIYEQHMTRLEQLVPKSEEVPDLLHTMTLRAQESGVELSLVRPEKEEPGEFYTKQSYIMTVIGPYHNVGRFLAAIGSLQRIITPGDLNLQPHGDPKLPENTLDANFKIRTYVIPEKAAAGAPATKPPEPAKT